jgi:hypothetical protein
MDEKRRKAKFILEDCDKVWQKYGGDVSQLPTREEVEKLNVGDYVDLIFTDKSGKSERLWLKVTKNRNTNNHYMGKLIDKAAIVNLPSDLDEVEFDATHIASLIKESEVEFHLHQSREPVDVLLIKRLTLTAIRLSGTGKNPKLYQLLENDKKFFEQEIASLETAPRLETYRLFLSLILILVVPKIKFSYENGDGDEEALTTPYLTELKSWLVEVLEVYQKIGDREPQILEELRLIDGRTEVMMTTLDDLYDLYGAQIEEAIWCVEDLIKNPSTG